MWNLRNMMHENNTMSQQHTSTVRSDNTHARIFTRIWAMCWALVVGGAALSTSAQPTVSVQDSLSAYAQVDRWVRQWEVPSSDDDDIQYPSLSAAIVTLRVNGRVLGRGSSVTMNASQTVLYNATKQAIASASAKLPQDRDAMWNEFIEDLSRHITITIEIADVLVPISDSQIDLPGFGYTPGSMGLVVRRGDRFEVAGPESMLMRDTDLTQSAMAMSNTLAGDASAMLKSPRELVESGFAFFRFEPVVLAQPGPMLGASFLDRGGRVIDRSEIGMRSIETFASNIAIHLMSRQWGGIEPYGMMGTLDPVSGQVESPYATPFEQAISAYALLRYGESGETHVHKDATISGTSVLKALARVKDPEVAPWSEPLGACMSIIALSQIQLIDILGNPLLNAMRLKTLEALDGLLNTQGELSADLPMASHGLVAYALVRAKEIDPRDRTGAASKAINQIIGTTPPSALVAQMPFLGWAIVESNDEHGFELNTLAGLMEMRELVWEHQLNRADLDWTDRDLAGGVVFTSASAPLPSWLTLKPLAFLATMLGDQRLTPGTIVSGDVPAQIGKQVDAIRFVRQLCATDETLHFYESGEKAQWGVRMSLWDQSMPVEVDAMALLTLTETTRAIELISDRPADEPAP